MHPAKIDLPVLLIFFTRTEIFSKVFEQVKKARPSKLFLYQDGPRENRPDDPENIKACRAVAESIDWECEVHRFYQPRNVGCDPSEFIAQKWAFGIVDRCLVLEDDDVPSQSFFPFCAELLEKYKDDTRINMICGMNHVGISENVPDDYFFSTSGAICGWASWRRVTDTWEEKYDFLDDPYALRLLSQQPPPLGSADNFINTAGRNRRSGKAHYESILGASSRLNSRLNIVPTKNMISNIGFGVDAVHSGDFDLMPKGVRKIFFMKTHEIDFPLKHPKYVICNTEHTNQVYRILGCGHPWVRLYRRVECRVLWLKKLLARALAKRQ